MNYFKILIIKTLLFLVILNAITLSSNAQTIFQTKSISIFKDGSAFFHKSAKLPINEASYFLEEPAPRASFGSLWFTSLSGDLASIQTKIIETKEVKETKHEFKSSDFRVMIAANLNKQITLHLFGDKVYAGKVQRIDRDYIIFQTGDKWLNLRVDRIESIEFEEQPNYADSSYVSSQTVSNSKSGILLKFKSKKAIQPIEMTYLQKGLGWIPAYHLNLKDNSQATFTLQAVVSNQAEDIEKANINFVVGVPNFTYKNQLSPLGSTTVFNNLLQNFQKPSQIYTRDLANRGGRTNYYVDGIKVDGAKEIGLTGSQTEDLFFYHLKDVSLKKGDRAFFTILESSVKVDHIYEVKLESFAANNYYYQRNQKRNEGFSFEQNFKNKVWHSVSFPNNTGTPLTAGAVMVTKSEGEEKRPISQDNITFTPINSKAFLKLTVAPDVSVRDFDQEIKREEDIEKIDNNLFDRVTIEGKIFIKNYKDKAITLSIKRQLPGQLIKTNEAWNIDQIIMPRKETNPISNIEWKVKLKAGEKREIQYEYSFLTR